MYRWEVSLCNSVEQSNVTLTDIYLPLFPNTNSKDRLYIYLLEKDATLYHGKSKGEHTVFKWVSVFLGHS